MYITYMCHLHVLYAVESMFFEGASDAARTGFRQQGPYPQFVWVPRRCEMTRHL